MSEKNENDVLAKIGVFAASSEMIENSVLKKVNQGQTVINKKTLKILILLNRWNQL